MTHVTCRLIAKNRDQLWNPAVGNRVLATFTFCCLTTQARHLRTPMESMRRENDKGNEEEDERERAARVYGAKPLHACT